MKVRWSRLAVEDIHALRAYIGEHDSAAAQKMAQTILSNVNKFLPENPELGRPGRVPATREFVIAQTPFIIPYRVRGQTIQILRVYHAARSWPEKLLRTATRPKRASGATKAPDPKFPASWMDSSAL